MTRKRILIIDDERLTRISLADFLEESGYDTTVAVDGESAIQLHRFHKFDVCIVDIRMPGMDGVEVIQVLHQIASESIYIICTGSPQFVVPPILEKLGIKQQHVVFKPILDMQIFVPLIDPPSNSSKSSLVEDK